MTFMLNRSDFILDKEISMLALEIKILGLILDESLEYVRKATAHVTRNNRSKARSGEVQTRTAPVGKGKLASS